MKRKLLAFILSGILCLEATAQEPETDGHRPKIRGAIMMANSHVPTATNGEKNSHYSYMGG